MGLLRRVSHASPWAIASMENQDSHALTLDFGRQRTILSGDGSRPPPSIDG